MCAEENQHRRIKGNSMRKIDIISSKSMAHRAYICSALAKLCGADGEISSRDFADSGRLSERKETDSSALARLGSVVQVECRASSKDIDATISCLEALVAGQREMHPGESGSTLRFLLPIMGALGHSADFYGEGRLPERPLSPLYEELTRHGCKLSPMGSIPLTIEGQLEAGDFNIAGDVSSQYISGLLFALPLLEGDSRIIISGKFESKAYVDMTMKVLRDFGIEVDEEPGEVRRSGSTVMPGEEAAHIYNVPGGQKYVSPGSYTVEGDWSNACFWLAAGALVPGGIAVGGLDQNSLQGDKAIVPILEEFGARVDARADEIWVGPPAGAEPQTGRGAASNAESQASTGLVGIEIDASQIPDMVPVLAVLASAAAGDTVIKNAGRLRIKESDRLASVTQVLNALGADIEEKPEGLVIHGVQRLKGGKVSSHNDHRIAMMAAIASLISEGKVEIEGKEAVAKSYPRFFEDLRDLELDRKVE
ncbi:MAG: 3-phosphoshikimate 1-carboxyvinyltransferase [Clostridia bacterium]|nr:3-phosphoshikimate 1-carboxyvinyltransferase [Clostridia bacterium]